METLKDCFEHAKWLMEKGRGDEPCKLFFPKLEAQRRKVNKEGYKRVILQMDEQLYKDFHEMKDRIVTLCHNNPPLAYSVMLQLISAVKDETITSLADAEQPSLGDA